jgi:hypothetical protein
MLSILWRRAGVGAGKEAIKRIQQNAGTIVN